MARRGGKGSPVAELQLKAQKVLQQFADTSVPEEDANRRGLKIHHRRRKTPTANV